tara:strand:- start:678 stop:860 length:183 start_codon:yes stop_codon:yes gene_type:complete
MRIKELASALKVDSSYIIAVCTVLKIPGSSPLSSLQIEECKRIINYLDKDNHNHENCPID